MRILLADDDAVSLHMMRKLLESSGYEVMTAHNGREAVTMLTAEGCPRLALVDWMMPELDGPGVCREIRSRHESLYIYITLLTSKQLREDVVAGLEAGADDYLTKPCNPEELKARLRTGLRILDLEDRLVEAREGMRFKATHDALTGLWNRGVILADLDRELGRTRRGHSTLSILLCDLDHFKQINDTYGHLVGDELLSQIASRFTASVRSYDVIGRYGGEEFLILLASCDRVMTQKRAEDLREAVAGKAFPTSGGALAVTITIGALFSGDWGHHMTANQLLHEADLALYRAKANGRNCICMAHPSS